MQLPDGYDGEPIRYSASLPNDEVAKLKDRLEKGETALRFEPGRGYLAAFLRELKIPVASQMLVFSKTSFQRDLISPETPRAIYFNDRTYVGWVQGGPVAEVATVDPQLGAVFYLLKQDPGKPKIVRMTYECLQCHDSTGFTGGVPGNIMRSVYPDPNGQPILTAGTHITTDRSPMKERWGGWYVTGKHGDQRHLGNQVFPSQDQADHPDLSAGANVTDLSTRINVSAYLGKYSDIVALMVIEHQTNLQNLIIRCNHETRRALHYEQELNRELKRPSDYRSESTSSRIKSVAEPVVKALLFSGEARLTSTVTGTSGFAAHFAEAGPRDQQGRSLRDLDLKTRLFRYPCSYLVYSEEFDGLPDPAKDYIYRRLWEVLGGTDRSADFAHLSELDRRAISDILLETKPTFAACKGH